MAPIKLQETYKYWRGYPHQLDAVNWLDKNLTPEQRAEFEKRFRAAPVTPPTLQVTPVKASVWLYLMPTGDYVNGFRKLRLQLRSGAKVVDTVACISGADYRQDEPFVHPNRDWSGSDRPIPENVYALGPLEDSLVDRGTYSWGEGLGQYWVELTPKHHPNNRSAIGIHEDANASYSPGSAGCVCPLGNGILRVAKWMQAAARPKELIVDWSTGYLKEKGVSLGK